MDRRGRRCSVCTHENLERIDVELLSGTASFENLGRDFGVSSSALRRHLNAHTRADVHQTPIDADSASNSLLECLLGLLEDMSGVRSRAKEIGNDILLLKACAAQATLATSMSERLKITDEIIEDRGEARAILLAGVEVLPGHQQAAREFVEIFRRCGEHELANNFEARVLPRSFGPERRALEPQ